MIAITALATRKLGEDGTYATGSWCWISKEIEPFDVQIQWMYLTGKAWELITYLVTATLYILLKLFTWRMVIMLSLRMAVLSVSLRVFFIFQYTIFL